jgi:molybdate transport system regulatory protein
MDMSYRRAWLLIDEMNRMFKEPVIAAVTGGAHGGGAQLTELGQNVIATYRAVEADAAQILSKRLGKVLGLVTMAQPSAGRRSKRI